MRKIVKWEDCSNDFGRIRFKCGIKKPEETRIDLVLKYEKDTEGIVVCVALKRGAKKLEIEFDDCIAFHQIPPSVIDLNDFLLPHGEVGEVGIHAITASVKKNFLAVFDIGVGDEGRELFVTLTGNGYEGEISRAIPDLEPFLAIPTDDEITVKFAAEIRREQRLNP